METGVVGVNRLVCRNVSKYGTLEVVGEPPAYKGDSERELRTEVLRCARLLRADEEEVADF